MAVKEKEDSVEEVTVVEDNTKTKEDNTKSKKACVSKTELDKVNKSLAAFKKEVASDVKVLSSKFDENDKNMKMLIASLNDIVKRIDALEKTNSSDDDTTSKIDLINDKIESIEYDVGELIDKVDVIFEGSGDESEDLVSRIEKLERSSGRLHRRNA